MNSQTKNNKQQHWFVFQDEQLLIESGPLNINLLSSASITPLMPALSKQHQIAEYEHDIFYSAELPIEITLPTGIEKINFRKAISLLQSNWYAIAAKAYSIITWDRNHQFCSRCGHVTSHKPNTFERICSACGLAFYPRISPSMIVLIRKDDHILMARGHHFLPGAYGLIAGFVEAGESVEDTVHREVAEEVGIKIKNLRYFGSQAWPFPDSLMIAFFADYASGELTINHNELENAGWYRYDQLPGYPSTSISISRKLIDHYLAEMKHTPIK